MNKSGSTSIKDLNKTSSNPYTDYYNDALVEKVKARFIADVEFFKYEFNPTIKTKSLGILKEDQKKDLSKSYFMQTFLKDKKALRKMKLNNEKNGLIDYLRMIGNRLLGF